MPWAWLAALEVSTASVAPLLSVSSFPASSVKLTSTLIVWPSSSATIV